MTSYRAPDGGYPRCPGDITRAVPSWSDGDPLPDGWHQVTRTPVPADILETYEDDTKRYLSHVTRHIVGLEEVDGEWRQTWTPGERLPVGITDEETGEWTDQPRLIAEYVDGEWIEPTVSSEQ